MMNGARSEASIAEIRAPPRSAVALPRVGRLWAIVAGEDDQRVVFDAGCLDGIEDLSGAEVHLGQAIGPITVAGFAGELQIWQRRHVHQRERNVGIERPAALALRLMNSTARRVISASVVRRLSTFSSAICRA